MTTRSFFTLLVALVACALLPGRSEAAVTLKTSKTQAHMVKLVILTDRLDFPWSLAFLPDGRMLVTERPGRLRIVHPDGSMQREPIKGLPPMVEIGQGGLMDVALHPRFAQNQLVYLSYAAQGEGGVGTEVLRGRLNEDRLEDVQVIFRMQPKSRSGVHFGSRLAFDREGHLFVTLGDRGAKDRAQKLDDDAGSIVRINDDGSIPSDNPFAKRDGVRPEIYAYGNRNVQGAALHPGTGELWIHEHGPQGGDELNIARAGANYGWPIISYGVNYGLGTRIGEGTQKPGMEQPLHVWVPSIAPSGMAFYTGDKFPKWKDNLLVGALRGRALVRLVLEGDRVVSEERMLSNDLGRIRDVRVSPDGSIYLLIDSDRGLLVRVEPAE
jgi:glucose/arabinose dehydrogenase